MCTVHKEKSSHQKEVHRNDRNAYIQYGELHLQCWMVMRSRRRRRRRRTDEDYDDEDDDDDDDDDAAAADDDDDDDETYPPGCHTYGQDKDR